MIVKDKFLGERNVNEKSCFTCINYKNDDKLTKRFDGTLVGKCEILGISISEIYTDRDNVISKDPAIYSCNHWEM
jgi:hypothetical protein